MTIRRERLAERNSHYIVCGTESYIPTKPGWFTKPKGITTLKAFLCRSVRSRCIRRHKTGTCDRLCRNKRHDYLNVILKDLIP